MKIPTEALNLMGDGFFTRYYSLIRESRTNVEAYDKTETEYKAYFGKSRFSGYDSFRKCITRKIKK